MEIDIELLFVYFHGIDTFINIIESNPDAETYWKQGGEIPAVLSILFIEVEPNGYLQSNK